MSGTHEPDKVAAADLAQEPIEADEGTDTNAGDTSRVSDADEPDEVAVADPAQEPIEADEGTDTSAGSVPDTDRDNGMSVSETDDELPEATTVGFTTVSAGTGHTCGIRTDNTVTCWM